MVRGSTLEERIAARVKRGQQRRVTFYSDRIKAATSAVDRLGHACAYLRAVADDLDVATVNELAVAVTRMADERNTR